MMRVFTNIIGSILISSILFLFVPVSYYLFHLHIRELIHQKRTQRLKINTIVLNKKKKKIRQYKMKKVTAKRINNITKMKFKLNLDVLSSDAGGAEIAGEQQFGNVIDESEADMPPIKKVYFSPPYPLQAKAEGIEGVVIAKLLIDERGRVIRINILRAPKIGGFADVVRQTAKNWIFEPAKVKNIPIKVWATQVIEFKL